MEYIGSIFSEFLTILINIRDLFRDNVVFGVGILLITGYFLAKLFEKIKLPPLIGYIIAGLLLGESILGFIPDGMEQSFGIITEVAIGILAVTIGTEFNIKKLNREGFKAILLSLLIIVFTFIIVFITLYLLGFELIISILLGIVACTTAPAITLNVIKNLRVRGKFVDYVYSIVSINDAFIFLIFGLVAGWISFIINISNQNIYNIFIIPLIKIISSIGLGILLGFILHITLKRMRKLNEILIVSLGLILFSTAVSTSLGLSIILVNLSLGTILINLSNKNERLFRVRVMYPLMPPIYSLFFALAGITLDISILTDIRVISLIIIYVISRFIGKYTGSFIGATILKLESNIKNYIGLCMIPQAGIAIGLTMVLDNTHEFLIYYPNVIPQIINIILISAFFNQILGRIFTKFSVIKALDIEI